jgi:hypothetical protein
LGGEGREVVAGLSALPPLNGITWRGEHWEISRRRELEKRLVVGGIYNPRRFFSTSSNKSIAEKFARNGNPDIRVIFRIRGKTGRDISSVSTYPEEEEVLFAPGAAFRITSVKRRSLPKGKFYFDVQLEEI